MNKIYEEKVDKKEKKSRGEREIKNISYPAVHLF